MEWVINITIIKWDISYICESSWMIAVCKGFELECNQEFHRVSLKYVVPLSIDEVMTVWVWELICQRNWVWAYILFMQEMNWQMFERRVWLMTVSLQHRLQLNCCYGISDVSPHMVYTMMQWATSLIYVCDFPCLNWDWRTGCFDGIFPVLSQHL